MIATIVDTQALLDTVVASVVAGLGVTLIFSIALYGVARFGEMTRVGRGGSAMAFGALAIAAAIAFAAAITVGIIVMTSK